MKRYTVKYRTGNKLEWDKIEKSYQVKARNERDILYVVSNILIGIEEEQALVVETNIVLKRVGTQVSRELTFGYDPFFNNIRMIA